MRITRDEIKSRIKLRLGRDLRQIELSVSSGVDHIGEAIDQALELFNEFIFRSEPVTLLNQAGPRLNVDLSSDELLLRIVDVQFSRPREIENYGNLDIFGLTERSLLIRSTGGKYSGMYGSGRRTDSTLYELKSQQEMSDRVRGNEPDWWWDDNNKVLALYIPAGPYDVMYLKAYEYTVETLPQTYTAKFLKAVEGFTRQILGDVRGKYGNQIPGPTGSIDIDASDQKQRGEKLVDEIKDYFANMPIVPGYFQA